MFFGNVLIRSPFSEFEQTGPHKQHGVRRDVHKQKQSKNGNSRFETHLVSQNNTDRSNAEERPKVETEHRRTEREYRQCVD